MIKLFFKIGIYLLLMLLILEALVRLFHLAKDTPNRFIDEYKVEKWEPNQKGYEVTGNRRQNFAEYKINNSGYNSYREFNPTKESIEIALVGDSFIQGFHQNYNNSIGKKIEITLPEVQVYEYGYAGYDFADQMHLVNSYKDDFDLIDHVVLYLDFNTDLTRAKYEVIQYRLALQTPLNKALKKCKLLVYAKNIGLLDPPKRFIAKILNTIKGKKTSVKKVNQEEIKKKQNSKTKGYISNFKNLVKLYNFDKKRFYLLLDASKTPHQFLNYLNENNFKFIDFNEEFKNAYKPTYLIYDQHWNNYGRTLIAKKIAESISLKNKYKIQE